DVEVRDASNTKINQQIFVNQSFAAGQTRTYTSTWRVPANQAPATYRVTLGVFTNDFSSSYIWNDNAGTITVASASASPTPTRTPVPTATSVPVAGTSYYVDCTAGADTNAGTAQSQAWRSLAKANGATLKPGDRLFLNRGCTWTGPLQAHWTGTADKPITI